MATALSKAPMHDPPTVEHLMVARGAPGYVELKAEASLAEAVTVMREAKTGSALVAGIGGATFGVVTERDYIAKAAVYDEDDPHTLPVHQVLTMCKPVASDGRIADCLSVMAAGSHRHLPVVDLERGVVEGQIAMRDILGFYLDFKSACTPRPLGEDTEDFYQLFDDDEGEE